VNGNPFHNHKLDGDTEDDGVSGKITTEINKNSTNTEVPGAKAVYEHVKEKVYYAVLSAQQYTDEQIVSGLTSAYQYIDEKCLSSVQYTDKEISKIEKEISDSIISSQQYTDNKISSALIDANQYTNIAADTVLTTAQQYTDKEVSGKADSAEFTNIIPEENIKNGLYITDENAVNIYDGEDWRNLSKALSDTFDIDGDLTETVPTLYAVSAFVEEKIKNVIIKDIIYGVSGEQYSWNENILTVEHNLNTEIPTIYSLTRANETDNLELAFIPFNIIPNNLNMIKLDCKRI
jgi:hypothetical protein